MNFNSTTPIDITLQARDWHYLAFLMIGNSIYNDIVYNLKLQFQVGNPPSGQTNVTLLQEPLGDILRIFYTLHSSYGKEIGKATRNRFRTSLESISNQEITDFFTELDAIDISSESDQQEIGRKYLRGRLG